MSANDRFPPYAFVPGLWPHPHSDPAGHRFKVECPHALDADWPTSPAYLRGIELFDAGYYWEAHEAWEGLWHAAGRRGDVADFLKALIQFAVVGVKVREGRLDGARTHAARAAELLRAVDPELATGLDRDLLLKRALETAKEPPPTPSEPRRPVERVFAWDLPRDLPKIRSTAT
jgi:predicted metal-dependent hydrolase